VLFYYMNVLNILSLYLYTLQSKYVFSNKNTNLSFEFVQKLCLDFDETDREHIGYTLLS
jgi:hypothetical protein